MSQPVPPNLARRRRRRLGAAVLLAALAVADHARQAPRTTAQTPSADEYVLVDAAGGAVQTIALLGDDAVVAGIGARVAVLDAADRAAPRVVGRTALLPAAPRDVAAAGDRVFAALGGSGLAVIDVTHRATPTLAARLCLPRPPGGATLALHPPRRPASTAACADGGGPPIDAVGAAMDGSIAFAAGGGGLLVVDAADPYRPREAGWLPLGVEARAIATLPGTALVLGAVASGDEAGNRLIVVDVRTPDEPAVRSWLKLGGVSGAFGHLAAGSGVAVAGGLAGAAVIDLAVLDRPRVAARIDRFVAALDVRAYGGRTLAALATDVLADPLQRAVFDDLTLFDISAPAMPRRLAGHATATIVRPTGVLLGAESAGEPSLVLSSMLAGCTVLERRGAGGIVAVGEALTGSALRVATGSGHAFVIEGDPTGVIARQRLVVVDAATGAPRGSIAGLLTVMGMTPAGDRLYVLEGRGGVRIVSTAVVTAPQTIGYITDLDTFLPPAAGPGWIALVDFAGTVHILDARDPANIRKVAAFAVSQSRVMDIAALGDRLLLAGPDRLFAFDLSDPTLPRPIGQTLYDNAGVEFEMAQLAVGSDRAWVVGPDGGLVAFDARPALPRRINRFDDIAGLDVVDVGGRAIVRVSDHALGEKIRPTNRMLVVDAPFGGGGGVVGAWAAPESILDAAPDPSFAAGIVVATGAYGLSRWQRRGDVAPTATPSEAPARPTATRAARTAVPPDPAHPHRAFLPLVTRALAEPKQGAAISLAAVLGGVAGAAAAAGDFGYVTSGDRVVAYRLRGADRPAFDGPETLGSAAVGERILALAVSHGRLAALVGPPRALELLTIGSGPFGGDEGGGGEDGQGRAIAPIPPGDGTGLRLIDVADPSQPRPAARVSLPPGAIDVASGDGDTGGWFAAVGSTSEGGYLVMVDARDAQLPQTTRLNLGDVRPVGVAVAGRRAVVQLSGDEESAVRIIHLDRPGAPANGGTVSGLAAATTAGGVAAARDRGFAVTSTGLAVVDLSGREPRLASVAAFDFNDFATASVTAIGSNVWVGTRVGVTMQLLVFGDDASTFNFISLPYLDAVGLNRTMAVSNGVLLQAGGILGSVSASAVPVLDLESGEEVTGDGEVFDDVKPGLGHSAAVAAGPPGAHLAFATNANGSVHPLHLAPSDGAPRLGSSFSSLNSSLPMPPTGLAIRGGLGVLVGGMTPLQSLQVLNTLVAPVAEPPDSSRGTALDALRASPTLRRVVLADGFAWVAERNAGLSIFDVSEPTLTLAGRLETPGQPRGLAVRAGRVYVADGTAGLTLIDARNAGSPHESGHLAAPGIVGSVAIAADGRTAWITIDSADGAWLGSGRDRAAIWAVDVRDAARPRVIGTAGLAMDRVADAVLDGDRLYVAGQRILGGAMAEPPGGTLSVAVVDVADVARPVVAGQWSAAAGYPFVPSTLSVVGARVVVALGEGGVAVLDVR